jgi:hypothetical protein
MFTAAAESRIVRKTNHQQHQHALARHVLERSRAWCPRLAPYNCMSISDATTK